MPFRKIGKAKKFCFIKPLYFLLIFIGLNRKELTIIEWILFFRCIVVQKKLNRKSVFSNGSKTY